MYFLYSLLLALGVLLATPYWLVKAIQEKKYLCSFRQRLGLGMRSSPWPEEPLWIHAVSVGEVLAARALFAALRTSHPQRPIIVSTVTLAGQALAKNEMAGAAEVFFFPFDWAFTVRRFLRKIRPHAVVLMETELWPNFLNGCSQQKVPVFLANGRISDRSFGRYRLVERFTASMLRKITAIGAQTHEDKKRFLELGAKDRQVRVTGNLKFDSPAPDISRSTEWLDNIRAILAKDGEVIVIGSSMKGEEPLFVEAFRRVRQSVPRAQLILAPRHPERFDEVADLLSRCGMTFRRRTGIDRRNQQGCEILLLDTIGELRAVYSLATVAVIGGSFLPFGGHNLLEPAALGKAIVFGPEMSNFRDMAELFLQEQAARQCGLESLGAALVELLQNARARKLLGQRAASTFRQNQGATQNTLSLMLPYIA